MYARALTINDLIHFCEEQKMYVFNSKEAGHRVCVRVPASYELDEDDSRRGLMRLKIKVFHTGLNRNGSYVSKESAEKAMESIKNRPVMANIHQLDNGEWDFQAHDYEIVKNDDGTNEVRYLEKQVGSFTEDEPFFEYDETTDRTYVVAYAVIPEDYTKAAEIIRNKNGTKNSCELCIDEFSYDAQEKHLNLDAFYISASTLLGRTDDGTEISEGMLGSRADIADFSENKNSILANPEYKQELIEMQEKIAKLLSCFNIEPSKEGGKTVSKLDELLAKYEITLDELTFDIEDLTDDELEAKFAEKFNKQSEEIFNKTCPECGAAISDDATECPECGANLEDDGEEFSLVTTGCVKNFDEHGNVTINFTLSHEDIRSGLYELIRAFDEQDDDYYYIRTVYDDHFIMQGWCSNKIYKQSYAIDGENISFSGERVELFEMLLTESEKMALDEMRANYESLKNFKVKTELKEKQDILADSDFELVKESEEYKEKFEALSNSLSDYSVDEVREKANALLGECLRSKKFALEKTENKIPFSIKTKTGKKKPYGNLFDSLESNK